uniref:Uncharacterized protein n=1 Tax=Mustela putorius furo TaxID=9669 RepID=M3Y666_MUSPF
MPGCKKRKKWKSVTCNRRAVLISVLGSSYTGRTILPFRIHSLVNHSRFGSGKGPATLPKPPYCGTRLGALRSKWDGAGLQPRGPAASGSAGADPVLPMPGAPSVG